MKLHRTFTHHPQNILVVPLVNVLVVVLAFFTLSGTFVSQQGISVSLPYTSFVLGPQRHAQIVSIAAGAMPVIYYREKKVTTAELDRQLAEAEGKDRSLIIRADGSVPHEVVTAVMNIGLQRGFAVAIAGGATPASFPGAFSRISESVNPAGNSRTDPTANAAGNSPVNPPTSRP